MSDFIKKSLAKEAKDKAAVQQKMSSTSKSSSEPPVVTKPEKLTNWETNFDGMSEERQEFVNLFEGDDMYDQVFMNALNGQYKYYIDDVRKLQGVKKGEKGYDKSLKKLFSDLGNLSWDISKLAKTTENYGDSDRAKMAKYKNAFTDTYSKIQASMDDHGSDFGLAFDESFRLTDPEKVLANSQQAETLDIQYDNLVQKFGTSWGNPFGGPGMSSAYFLGAFPTGILSNEAQSKLSDQKGRGWTENITVHDKKANSKYVFNKIGSYEGQMNDQLLDVYKPTTSSWIGMGYANWSNKKFSSETDVFDNREKVVAIGTDAINYISKYGNDSDKKKANDLKLQLGTLQGDVGERQKWFKDNEIAIKDLVSDTGYYTQQHLFKRHKDSFNSEKYYPGTPADKKRIMDMVYNQISTLTEHQIKTDAVFSKLRTKAASEYNLTAQSLNGLDGIVAQRIINDDGSFLTWNEFQKTKEYGSLMLQNKYHQKKLKNDWSYYLGDKMFDRPLITKNAIKDVYYKQVGEYKESYNDLKSDQIFNDSILTLNLGNDTNKPVGHDNIGTKSDSPKNINAMKVKKMIGDGIKNGSVYAEPNMLRRNAVESSLKTVKDSEIEKMYNDFYENNESYSLYYSQNTSIKGKSAYILTTKGENPKSVTFYIGNDIGRMYGEKYAESSYVSPEEWSFRNENSWVLQSWNDDYEYGDTFNIIRKGKGKYLSFNRFDAETGTNDPAMIYLGEDESLRIEDAEEMARSIMNTFERDTKNYINQ